MLWDLSAAFDTIDHRVLLDTLESDFGVVGNDLKWIESFLSGRKQRLHRINQEYSSDSAVICGVSQGSCPGPVLFLFYISQVFQIVDKDLPFSHGYADVPSFVCLFVLHPQLKIKQSKLSRIVSLTFALDWFLTN